MSHESLNRDTSLYEEKLTAQAASSVLRFESLVSQDVWRLMSIDERATAIELWAAASVSPLVSLGMAQDTLRIVSVERGDSRMFAMIHTGSGIDVSKPREGGRRKSFDKARSWNGIMSPSKDYLFQLQAAGRTIDGRSGMSSEVYKAKYEDALTNRYTLPDSRQLALETDDDWTFTILTGEEPLSDGSIRLAQVKYGLVVEDSTSPGDSRPRLRVCPAWQIPSPEN